MRWRLILEEYNPEVIHIQGSRNIADDSLNRLEIVDANNPKLVIINRTFYVRKRGTIIQY